ncbi:MAG: hypothetical protein HYX48_02775 [Chlamydiales bacterium]|nr:hypothetical protein [Chlamydiales bacterium]
MSGAASRVGAGAGGAGHLSLDVLPAAAPAAAAAAPVGAAPSRWTWTRYDLAFGMSETLTAAGFVSSFFSGSSFAPYFEAGLALVEVCLVIGHVKQRNSHQITRQLVADMGTRATQIEKLTDENRSLLERIEQQTVRWHDDGAAIGKETKDMAAGVAKVIADSSHSFHDENSHLKDNTNTLQKIVSSQAAQLNTLGGDLAKFQAQISEQGKASAFLQAVVGKLSVQIQASQQESQKVGTFTIQIDSTLAQDLQKINELSTSSSQFFESVMRDVSEKSAALAAIGKTLEAAAGEIARAGDAFHADTTAFAQLQKQHTETQQKLESTQGAYASLVENMKKEREAFAQERASLTTLLENSKSAGADLQKISAEVKSAAAGSAPLLADAKSATDALKKEADSIDAQIAALNNV